MDNESKESQNLLIVNTLGQVKKRMTVQAKTRDEVSVTDLVSGQYWVKSETTGQTWRFTKL